jgi:hypothetical protein
MTCYPFHTQQAQGEAGEAVLDRFFSRWYRILPAGRAQQRRGIDRVFVAGQRRLAVEYKSDSTAAKTGNAFVETVSVDTSRTPGWAYTSQADFLVYFIPPDGLVYVVQLATLRRALPGWLRRYPVRAIPNEGYHTHGVLVPLDEFERLAQRVYSI